MNCNALKECEGHSELYNPVGEVTEVNEALCRKPKLTNKSFYAGGWVIVTLSNPSELNELMSDKMYEKYVNPIKE
ncbi:hypothetical protein U0070_002384 [Myodes glareolus]|uniref:Uncharacterized protein n=1 Tax=Myodes glareolus TaxID=447135 RepID=A0AAW0IXF2_MYOGA